MFLFGVAMSLLWIVPLLMLIQTALTAKPEVTQAVFMFAPWLERAVEVGGNGGVLAVLPLGIPLMIVMTGGTGLAHYRRTGFSGEVPPFFLTKPISSAELVTLKWSFGARLVAFAWGLALLLALAWTGLQGMLPDTATRLYAAYGPAWWLMLLAVLLGLVVVSWMWLSSGLWAGLCRSIPGTLGGPIGTMLLLGGWASELPWLSALGVAACLGPTFGVLRGWRLGVGVAALAVALGAVAAGWPVVAVPVIPLPGMLAALPALERRRHE
jgi:hypothetical protein